MSMLVCSLLVFTDCFSMLSYTFGMGTAFFVLAVYKNQSEEVEPQKSCVNVCSRLYPV